MTGGAQSIEHATQIYSYLLKPTTANHTFADVIFRQFNVPLGGGAGERADYLQRLAPLLRKIGTRTLWPFPVYRSTSGLEIRSRRR